MGQESRFSDQYALAVTVFELIAGRNPFCGKLDAMMRQIRDGAGDVRTVLRVVPKAVADVLARGMARRPEDRFASCSEFAAAIADVIPGGEMAIEPVAEAKLACPECNVLLAIDAAYGGDVLECRECRSHFVPQRHLAWLEAADKQSEILARQTRRLGEDLQLLPDSSYQKCANCLSTVLVRSGESATSRPCPHCGGPLDGVGGDQVFKVLPVVPPVLAARVAAPDAPDPPQVVIVVPRRRLPLDYRQSRKHREQRQDLFAAVTAAVIVIVLIVIVFSL